MEILPIITNLKQYLPVRYFNKSSLNSKQLEEETSDIELSQVNTLDFDRKSNSATVQNNTQLLQYSPQMQSLLEEPPSNLPIKMIVGSTVFLLVFSLWAWFGKVESVGKAHGKLVPKGETYKIESIDSAKISQIAIEEGEKVKAGQAIARLDSEQHQTEVTRLNEILALDRSELNQKHYLLEKVKLESKTQRAIALAEIQAQQLAIDSAVAQTEIAKRSLAQKQSQLRAYISRQKKVENLNELEREQLAQIHSQLKEHRQRVARLKPLLDEGAITQEAMFQATQALHQAQQQSLDRQLQGISNIDEQIFQSEQSSQEIKASIIQSQGELVLAQQKIERLQTELIYKVAHKQRSELESQQKVQQLELEINQTKTKIAETKNRLANAKNQLGKRLLRSPVAGTVLAFNVTNPGKVVQLGETVAEIAPHTSPLVLLAMLPDREAGFVEPGMSAQIKFDAYSYQDYGAIPGKVISVSADSQTDEKLGTVYQIEIKLERNYVMDDLKRILFKPGQTAVADIAIRQRRVADILLDPIKKLEQDGVNL